MVGKSFLFFIKSLPTVKWMQSRFILIAPDAARHQSSILYGSMHFICLSFFCVCVCALCLYCSLFYWNALIIRPSSFFIHEQLVVRACVPEPVHTALHSPGIHMLIQQFILFGNNAGICVRTGHTVRNHKRKKKILADPRVKHTVNLIKAHRIEKHWPHHAPHIILCWCSLRAQDRQQLKFAICKL